MSSHIGIGEDERVAFFEAVRTKEIAEFSQHPGADEDRITSRAKIDVNAYRAHPFSCMEIRGGGKRELQDSAGAGCRAACAPRYATMK